MKRITSELKAIADAHLRARMDDKFDDDNVTNREELISALRNGRTFSKLLDEIEIRYSTISSILMCRTLKHVTEAHRKAVYKGFKQAFPTI